MRILLKVFLITILILYVLIGINYATNTGKVTASAVRIREEMSTESNILTNAYKGEDVEILEENGEWYRVKYQNSTGYVKKEYIETNSNSTNTNTIDNTNTNNSSNIASTNSKNNTLNTSSNNTSNTSTVTNDINNVENTGVNNTSGVVISNTVIGLKLNPNLMSITVAQFETGKELTKLDEINNWLKVTDGTVTGWITKTKVTEKTENNKENTNITNEENRESSLTNNQKGKVNVETANVRKEANSSSERIGFLDYNDIVNIIAIEGEWYKIDYENTVGYVSKPLITLENDSNVTSRSSVEGRVEELKEEPEVTIQTSEEEANTEVVMSTSLNIGNEISNFAKQYLGTKYIVGGKNPEVGFDCSGFTRYVYSNFGYNLGTTSTSQKDSGTAVSRENMQIGDLIIFYNEEKSNVGHTGIYIGDGNFIHSANPERGVVIDNLNTNTYYNERFISARRILD